MPSICANITIAKSSEALAEVCGASAPGDNAMSYNPAFLIPAANSPNRLILSANVIECHVALVL